MEEELQHNDLDNPYEKARTFLEKYVQPPINEVGIFKDEDILEWRFHNKVKVVNMAESYLQGYEPKKKKLPVKDVLAILNFSSVEEDESLQEKWAALLANTILTEKLNTNLFKTILSELNNLEAQMFDFIFKYSVENHKGEGLSVTVKQLVQFPRKALEQIYGDISLEIENLLRLRLIKERKGFDSSQQDGPYLLTDLGWQFHYAVLINLKKSKSCFLLRNVCSSPLLFLL